MGLALVFCLALRIAFHRYYHLSFDPSVGIWQMLDVEWLRAAPIESIYLMHMQPPLLNALYAASLRLPDGGGAEFLELVFLAASMCIVALLYALLRQSRLKPIAAAMLAALFGVLPQTLLYENVYAYQHLEAALLLAATLLASRYLAGGRLSSFAAFSACLVTLALLRSLYHVGWIVFALFAVCIFASRRYGWDRRVLAVAMASVAIVTGMYVKNLAEFGVFSASSWDGMASVHMAAPDMPGDQEKFPGIYSDVRARAKRGEFSPSMTEMLAASDVWNGWMAAARDCLESEEKRTVLCKVKKSNGEYNFNHISIINYSRDLRRDSVRLLHLYPSLYVNHVLSSVVTMLGTPAWDYRDLAPRLKDYTDLWNRLMLYEPGHAMAAGRTGVHWWDSTVNRLASASIPTMVLVVFGALVVLVRGVGEASGYWRRQRQSADWLFPTLVLLLVFSVPNLINGVETQRIRYTIEAILYLAVISGFRTLLGIGRSKLHGIYRQERRAH